MPETGAEMRPRRDLKTELDLEQHTCPRSSASLLGPRLQRAFDPVSRLPQLEYYPLQSHAFHTYLDAMTNFDWAPIVAAFQAEDAGPIRRSPDGTWSISIFGSMKSIWKILTKAPAPFISRFEGKKPLFDQHGEEVDDESTSGVEASDEALAVLTWTDHWQAGLVATLTVYPTSETYEHALTDALALREEPPPRP